MVSELRAKGVLLGLQINVDIMRAPNSLCAEYWALTAPISDLCRPYPSCGDGVFEVPIQQVNCDKVMTATPAYCKILWQDNYFFT